ncbi:MAG: hypothetical protein K1X72_07295 [Pyrinomonadaceae bacterium]|nr:hypothetical protein [Pyrinomonadaceae bacterium]
MMKSNAIRKEETQDSEPINIGDRALDNLQFIRETMERSASFTAIPGYGGALMGVTAIGAAIIAHNQPNIKGWIITWLLEAVLAFCIGMFAIWQKAKNSGDSLNSAPARKFAFGFAPPLIAGVILTSLFYVKGLFAFMPTIWLTLYGTAVVTGGAYSVRIVPIVGWIFVGLGLISVFVDSSYGNLLMGIGFGGLQVIFGLVVARRYGG